MVKKTLRTGRTIVLTCLPLSYSTVIRTWYRGLKSKDLWSVTNLGKDVIALAKMIPDVAHAHDDATQGTMAIVTSDMTLYTTFMSKAETPVAFCRTFQAKKDTINTHGGCIAR